MTVRKGKRGKKDFTVVVKGMRNLRTLITVTAGLFF